jgi:hypothetical protein
MGKRRSAYRALVGKAEGRRPVGRPRRRWKDNIKINLRDVGFGGVHVTLFPVLNLLYFYIRTF